MYNKTLLALPSVAGTLTRGLTHFVRILAHALAPQSLALGAISESQLDQALLKLLKCNLDETIYEETLKIRQGSFSFLWSVFHLFIYSWTIYWKSLP